MKSLKLLLFSLFYITITLNFVENLLESSSDEEDGGWIEDYDEGIFLRVKSLIQRRLGAASSTITQATTQAITVAVTTVTATSTAATVTTKKPLSLYEVLRPKPQPKKQSTWDKIKSFFG